MTTAGVFVDSTTILYTQDRRDPDKQRQATAWLNSLLSSNRFVVSLQSLNETYAVVRRKPQFGHWRSDVQTLIESCATLATPPQDLALVREGWRFESRYRIGFWDSLQLASANAAGCSHFLSEDLNDGQVYGSVCAVNPFRHAPADVLGPAGSS